MSARLRLTLSYMGFLALAGAALMVIVYFTLRYVPEGNLTGESGFIPNRSDLLRAFVPRALVVLAGLAIVGLGGGWFLAGRMLRPLERIGAVARRVADGSLDQRVRPRRPTRRVPPARRHLRRDARPGAGPDGRAAALRRQRVP